ncbi:developmentally-regulated protein [Acrasis kona]|uniref:Developmentally-regulated protein n=1 Tax=Acrasis kona TaxID=1008807 RepID=A0AAW2ZK14_9EUKA
MSWPPECRSSDVTNECKGLSNEQIKQFCKTQYFDFKREDGTDYLRVTTDPRMVHRGYHRVSITFYNRKDKRGEGKREFYPHEDYQKSPSCNCGRDAMMYALREIDAYNFVLDHPKITSLIHNLFCISKEVYRKVPIPRSGNSEENLRFVLFDDDVVIFERITSGY